MNIFPCLVSSLSTHNPITYLSLPAHTVYNHRRNKVSRFVSQNFIQLKQEIFAGGDQTLSQAMSLAKVSSAKQPELFAELKANPKLYLATDPEPLVVALMVYGP